MANLSKRFKNYEEAIKYYNKVLLMLDKNSLTYIFKFKAPYKMFIG